METLIPLAIHVIAGALGAIVAGLVLKRISLGITGNILAGIVGGTLGGQILDRVGNLIGGYPGAVITGLVGGTALMVAVGILRKLVRTPDLPEQP